MSRVPALDGQVVLVTGAGAGIGAAGALELAHRGAIPVLFDCDADTLQATAARISPDTLVLRGDVTDAAACEAAVAAVLARYGRLDAVWANAGIASFGPLAHTDPSAWQRVIDVNVMGVFNTVRAALPAIMRQRGYVLVTASASSFAHPPAMSAYAASKAAVEAMCNAWRIELSMHGVAVGVIHASWVGTALVSEGAMHPGFQRLRATMPAVLNRQLEPEAAARIIVDGMGRRQRRIWVPGWVKMLHWLRPILHTPLGERELARAAPDIERFYLEGLQTHGRLASSFGPREHERAMSRQQESAPD